MIRICLTESFSFSVEKRKMWNMLRDRLNQIRKKLLKEKLDAIFVSSVSNIAYLSGYANFSKEEREAYILIGKDFEYIITDGRYSEAIKKEVPHLTLFERSHKTPTEKLLKSLKSKIKVLGIEEDNLTVVEHRLLQKHFKKIKHFDLNTFRSIKNKEEVEKIKKAAKIGDEAFKYILKKLTEGISEKQIAFEIEFFIKNKGADISFQPIVAFGKNSSIPHHKTGNTTLKKGDLILLDFGAKYQNYCSDMTRTIFFGKPTNIQTEIYNVVLSAQQKAVDFINNSIKSRKEIKTKDVDEVARKYIKSKGYQDIPHSLGHGVGLEVHEYPRLSPKSKEILKIGMVFSIEPGIYFPQENSLRAKREVYIPDFGGVRIEDLFVLEKNGLKQITISLKEITQL